MAEAAGLATGVVSTARITHATPAAMYAHTPNRDWESDIDSSADAARPGCKDIADQLVNWPAGDGFEVALGGGRAYFLPETVADPEDEGKTGRAHRRPQPHRRNGPSKANNHVFVWNKAQLRRRSTSTTGAKVLGLFERATWNTRPTAPRTTAASRRSPR